MKFTLIFLTLMTMSVIAQNLEVNQSESVRSHLEFDEKPVASIRALWDISVNMKNKIGKFLTPTKNEGWQCKKEHGCNQITKEQVDRVS